MGIIILTLFQLLSIVAADNFCYSPHIIDNTVPCRFFAAVIDAGSTGTRLHLYKYLHDINSSGLPVVVEQEIFHEVKPGLSSFTEDPRGAADSVRALLDHAKNVVPDSMWEKTPLALKATAGLRLLPHNKAEEIMSLVQAEIFNSGFFAHPEAVSILSGSDEGIYSWLTLNLLLKALHFTQGDIERLHRVAAFDLGGGSTQVTYMPDDREIFVTHPQYERTLNFFTNDMNLFTHSFLGNGLVSARFGILNKSTPDKGKSVRQLTTPCLPQGFNLLEWEYILDKYNISGTERYSFEECYDHARNFVDHSSIMKLDVADHSLYLFSYFFDRGLNAGLVQDNNGGTIKLIDYKHAAEKACKRTVEEFTDVAHWLPWQCLDLTYIYTLLHDGYGFPDSQELHLVKKIKQMEVAWAQGLSYEVITQFRSSDGALNVVVSNNTFSNQLWDFLYSNTNTILEYLNLVS